MCRSINTLTLCSSHHGNDATRLIHGSDVYHIDMLHQDKNTMQSQQVVNYHSQLHLFHEALWPPCLCNHITTPDYSLRAAQRYDGYENTIEYKAKTRAIIYRKDQTCTKNKTDKNKSTGLQPFIRRCQAQPGDPHHPQKSLSQLSSSALRLCVPSPWPPDRALDFRVHLSKVHQSRHVDEQ